MVLLSVVTGGIVPFDSAIVVPAIFGKVRVCAMIASIILAICGTPNEKE